MKNKTTQKLKSIIIAFILLIQLPNAINITHAQSTISINTSCILEWDTFISSTLSITEFKEYWKDILVRYNQNVCYYMDIDTVLKQIDTIRSRLRMAILGCKDDEVKTLKAQYYELEAELYYLRSFVSFADKKGKLISEEKIYKGLKKEYVDDDKIFNEEELKALFEKYKSKYKSRISTTYAKCTDASIKKLVDKWNELVNTVKGVGATAKSIKEDFEKAINTPATGTRGFIENTRQARKDTIAPMQTTSEILLQTEKTSDSQVTLDQLQIAIVEKTVEYQETVQQTSLLAEYEAIYKHGGDSIAESYEKILREFNKIIEDSYKPLEDLKQCAKKSADRQCQ